MDPPVRVFDSVDRRARRRGARRRPGPDVRLRDHAVRRHPHGPRRDVRRLRPAQPGLAQRRPRRRATCRTSPTSTTRCSSGPTRPARTGPSSPSARPSCSAPTWRRCACCRPTPTSGAVESIPLVVGMVERLQAAGASTSVDGRPLLLGHRDPAFGEVSGWTATRCCEVFAERGGDPDRPGKKDPLDCLLWQAERPGEPAWDSPLGRGRPGWHIECSAIARAHLGAEFDVQGGGSDLVFPHHEMSARRRRCVDPARRFARAYVHAGMVGLDGEKMSKSKGNLVLVSKLREQRPRPDGDPAGPARAPLPRATGSGTRPTLSAPGPARQVARRGRAGRRRAHVRGRRPTCWPRWPTTWTPRGAGRSTTGRRHRLRRRRRAGGRRGRPTLVDAALGVAL